MRALALQAILRILTGTDNVTFTLAAEATTIAPRTYNSFSGASTEVGVSRCVAKLPLCCLTHESDLTAGATGQTMAVNAVLAGQPVYSKPPCSGPCNLRCLCTAFQRSMRLPNPRCAGRLRSVSACRQ